MKLVSQNYGKQRVRLMKVLRETPRHEVKELEVGIRLEGDFEATYLRGDNRDVVATDTMKNIVHALAHQHLGLQTEPFALLVAGHFLEHYRQVSKVTVDTVESRWSRLVVDGLPHDHAFVGEGARPTARVSAPRGGRSEIESGIENLSLLKSTGSAFEGYPRDAFTTLPETADRVLATQMRAQWTYSGLPKDFNTANASILGAMLPVFALRHSLSVQATLFEMASAALAACRSISRVSLALPNRHYLPLNLKPFGLENPNVSFVPTDAPHGLIEAVVERDDSQ